MSEQYKGGVPLTGGLEVKGGGDSFPLVKAHDIYVDETHRLDEKLAELENGGGGGGSGVEDLRTLNGRWEIISRPWDDLSRDAGKNLQFVSNGVAYTGMQIGPAGDSSLRTVVYYGSSTDIVCNANVWTDERYRIIDFVGTQFVNTSTYNAFTNNAKFIGEFGLDLNIENGEGEGSLQQKGTNAKYEAQHVCGKYNDNKSDTLFEVGNGTSTKRSNAFEVLSNGSVIVGGHRGDKPDGTPDLIPENDKQTLSIPDIDTNSVADGIQSAVFGAGNRAYGDWNFIAGKDNKTFQRGAFAFGGKNAVGNFNTPNAYVYSMALGELNTIVGRSSFVGGSSNESTIYASYSFTYGRNNVANGTSSVIVGDDITMAKVSTSAAFGSFHTVNSSCVLVSGVSNSIDGYASNAFGGYLITKANYQTVLGVRNEANVDALFIVGRGEGTSANNRSNAFEVLKDGRAKAYAAAQDPEDLVRKKEFDEALENLPSGGNTVISGTWDMSMNPSVSVRMNAVFTNDLQSYKMLTVKLDKSEGWQVIYTRDDGTEDIVYTKGEWYRVSSLIPTTKRTVVFDGKRVIPTDTYNAFNQVASKLYRYKYVYQHNLIIHAGNDTPTVLGKAGDINIYYSLLSTSQNVTITNVWDELPKSGDGILPASGYIQVYGMREESYDEYYIVTGICMRDNKLHVETIGQDGTTALVKFKEFNLDRSYMQISKDTKITLNLGEYE